MNRIHIVLTVYIIMLIMLGLYAKNVRADMLQDYNTEIVSYIQTKHKVLPEYTAFKCVNGVLYKSRQVQRWHTGKAQTCEIIKMTRGEYEDYIITTLF